MELLAKIQVTEGALECSRCGLPAVYIVSIPKSDAEYLDDPADIDFYCELCYLRAAVTDNAVDDITKYPHRKRLVVPNHRVSLHANGQDIVITVDKPN